MKVTHYEVIIIGGSYAGLSAAMALGRSLRNVLIIDSGLPCNRQTPTSHNFLTQDGFSPIQITENAKKQVLKYPSINYLNDLAIKAEKLEVGFQIYTRSENIYKAQKIIIATGIKDLIPQKKGFQECWGITLIHCPYCHGYEFTHQKTAIMANGERAYHLASLVSNLTHDLSILTNEKSDFNTEQVNKLRNHSIEIIETNISEIQHHKGYMNNIIFDDGKEMAIDAIYAGFPFEQHSSIPVSLGCELTVQGHIKVNQFQETTIEGVYACGDNSSMMRSIANSVATGNITGAMVNSELCQEKF